MSSKKEIIEKIQLLLEELENDLSTDEQEFFAHNFDALELPEIVAQVAEYLQRHLHPYEAAIYWHLFNRSIVKTGKQYVRASTRGLQEGVIQSSSGQTNSLSYGSVQKALAGLEEKEVVIQAGDTNREGTLYKVNLPEEIKICQKAISESSKAKEEPVDEEKELDYYNVAENRKKVFERDDYECHYCGKQLTRFTATLDHIQPVSEGGDNSYDNLVTACLHCNSRRGSRPVMDIYTE